MHSLVAYIIFIFYEGSQYPIIFQGFVIVTYIEVRKGLKIIIIVRSFFRWKFFL